MPVGAQLLLSFEATSQLGGGFQSASETACRGGLPAIAWCTGLLQGDLPKFGGSLASARRRRGGRHQHCSRDSRRGRGESLDCIMKEASECLVQVKLLSLGCTEGFVVGSPVLAKAKGVVRVTLGLTKTYHICACSTENCRV